MEGRNETIFNFPFVAFTQLVFGFVGILASIIFKFFLGMLLLLTMLGKEETLLVLPPAPGIYLPLFIFFFFFLVENACYQLARTGDFYIYEWTLNREKKKTENSLLVFK